MGSRREQVDSDTQGTEKRSASTGRPTAASVDGLDSVVLVTDTRSWIAVAIGLLAVAIVLVWAVVARIPERLSVGGVMTRPDAIVRVVSPTTGVVETIEVVSGSAVDPGDQLATLIDTEGNTIEVVTSVGGIVQGVAAGVGEDMTVGAPIATVVDEKSSGTLSVTTYVTAQQALELAGVDEVTVAPATVDQNSYGSLDGQVVFVADVPASMNAMIEQLDNEALAEQFSATTNGVPYLVMIEFDDPPRWTGEAPPFDVVAGTLAEVSAITSRDRPIKAIFG